MADITFGIRLTAEGSGYVGAVRLAREETEKLGLTARKAGQEVVDANKASLASAVALGTAIGQVAVEAARAIGSWAAETVTAAADLKDLHDVTGSSVEDLSRLTNIAKVSGTSAGQFGDVIGRLAVRLSGADEEATKAANALNALGIKARDPARAMQELADKLSEYADDANKAAYAQAIFGRGGEKLLPLLKDIAEQTGIAATVTTKQAEEAEKLEKSLRALTVQASLFRDELLSGVIPALNSLFTALHADGVAEKLGLFSISAADRKDLESAIAATKTSLAEVNKLKAALENPGPGVFGAVAAWLSKDDLAVANAQLDAMTARLRGLEALANAANPDRNIHKNADRYLPKESLGALAGGAGTKAAKQAVDDFASSIDSLQGQLDKLSGADGGFAHYEKATKDILRAEAEGKKINYDAAAAYLSVAAALDRETKALKDDAEFLKNVTALRDADAKAARDLFEAVRHGIETDAKNLEQVQKQTASYEEQIDALRLTKDEILAKEEARVTEIANNLYATEGADKLAQAYENQAAAIAELRRAGAAREIEQQFQQTAQRIDESLTDALLNAWDAGENGAKKLLTSLKTMFANLVLRPVIQAVLAPVAGGIASLVSGPAAAKGIGGGLGGIASLFGEGAGAFSAASGAGIGAGIETLKIAINGGLDAVGGIAGVAGAVSTFLPIAGLAAIAVPLVAKLFDKGPANRTGTFASGDLGSDPSRDAVFSGKSAFGTFGIAKDFWLGPEAGAAFKPTLDAITKLDDTISQMVGGDLTRQISDALAQHSITVGLGKEGTDINASGGPGEILKDRYATVLRAIDAQLGDMVDAFQGTGDELANFVLGLVALKTTLGDAFKGLQASDISALGDAVGGIDKLATGLSFINANFTTEADQAGKAAQQLVDDFGKLGVSVPATHQQFLDLLSSFDLTTDAGRKLYAGVLGLSAAFVEVNGTATQAAAALQQSFASLDAAIGAYQGQSQGQQQSTQLNGLIQQLIGGTGNAGFTDLLSKTGAQGFAANLALIGKDDFAKYSKANQDLIVQIINLAGTIKNSTDTTGSGSGLSLGTDYYKQVFGFDGTQADNVVNDTLDALKRLRQGILDYVDGLKLGDLSPLTPQQKLEEARQQYQTTLTAAQGGDQAALGSITQSSDAYLKLSRDFFKSSQSYTDIFNTVTDQLTKLGTGDSAGAGSIDNALLSVLPKGSTLASAADFEAFTKFMAQIVSGNQSGGGASTNAGTGTSDNAEGLAILASLQADLNAAWVAHDTVQTNRLLDALHTLQNALVDKIGTGGR